MYVTSFFLLQLISNFTKRIVEREIRA